MMKMRWIFKMEKKLSKKTLTKSFHNWYYGNLTCFSQEHMQTFGYLCSMLPVVEELYDKKEDQARSMKTYTAFFNTEPQLGTVIVGMTAGLEEARANGTEDVDDETINGLRAGLMGPIAGIGDSLVVGTVIPILLGIALGMSTGGSPLGAIMYIIVWNLFAYFGMKFLYFKGYELGGKAVDFLVGPQGEALRESVTMLGGIVIGAVSATWISVTTSFTMTAAGAKKPFLDLQKTLDGVYPGLLTAVFVVGCWYLLSKKKMSPIKVMLLLSCCCLYWCVWLDSSIQDYLIKRRKKMNSQEKQGYIDEINYQKKMIHNLIKWLRNLFFLSSLGVLLMYYFSNILFIKIFAIILIIISILAIILVGKAIYSGKKNINKIVDQFSFKYKNSL